MKTLFKSDSVYSLRKSKAILLHVYRLFVRQKKKLTAPINEQLKGSLKSLEQEILAKNPEKAQQQAIQLESLAKVHLKKTAFDHVRDLVFALIFALVVAILVRQIWFEFYEIPSGSMRPTLKEQDRLVVSKTDFGINLPLTTEHLYFDPALVKRSGIFVFTGENMDIRDVDTLYFYVFPGKKQYIKRLMAKPGDTVYFYGGKIFGIDKEGNDICPSLQLSQLNGVEHVPFLHFEGKASVPASPTNGVYTPVILHQMNEPVARLFLSDQNQVRGEMLSPAQNNNTDSSDFGDLWGFKNFAMARLLTKEQVKLFTNYNVNEIEEGLLYLELKHHPTLSGLKVGRDEYNRLRPLLGYSTSIIPLQDHHLRMIFDNLYTARFVIRNGFAMRYGLDQSHIGKNPFLPHLPGVPDGCYEFYYGKAYKVKWQGITEELPPSHPLYRFDPQRVQLLYNIGIEFDLRFSPQTKNQRLNPARYAYFRDQNLYLLGAPILKKDDPTLLSFLEREYKKEMSSNLHQPYKPFEDLGPPINLDGTIDRNLIKQHGLTIPEHMYLALGDNHAMSADSRDFGFVPQGNLRGGPDFIFWPPGKRWGAPNQPPYSFFSMPHIIIWVCFVGLITIWFFLHRRKNKLPLSLLL